MPVWKDLEFDPSQCRPCEWTKISKDKWEDMLKSHESVGRVLEKLQQAKWYEWWPELDPQNPQTKADPGGRDATDYVYNHMPFLQTINKWNKSDINQQSYPNYWKCFDEKRAKWVSKAWKLGSDNQYTKDSVMNCFQICWNSLSSEGWDNKGHTGCRHWWALQIN